VITLDDSEKSQPLQIVTLPPTESNTSINLAQFSSLTLDNMSFMTVIANGGDVVTAKAAGQTLIAGEIQASPSDVFTGANAGGDCFAGLTVGMNGETINNFLGSDIIDIKDLNSNAATLAVSQTGGTSVLSFTDGVHSGVIILGGYFSLSEFTTANDLSGGTVIGLTPFH